MNKQKNIKLQSTPNSFLNFPNKINVLTIFLLVIIYGLTLAIISALLFPKYDYIVKLNYPTGIYNEEINPYIFVRCTAIDENLDDNIVDLKLQYRFFAYINAMSDVKPTKVIYAYSGLDNTGVMRYFHQNSKNGSNVPVSHFVVASALYPGGDGFQKYFMKVRYNMLGSNNVYETKELEISQDVIKITKKELINSKFTNNNSIEDLLTVTFTFEDLGATSKQYQTYIKIDFVDKTVPYLVNMQSWIVNDQGLILPFLGLYNYTTRAAFNPSYANTVHKYVNPEYLYMKLEYIDENNVVTNMFYKASIADLVKFK